MLLRSLRFTSLLCVALVAGLTLTHVLQSPGNAKLTGPEWLQVMRTFYGGFALIGGIAEVVGFVAAGATVLVLRQHGCALLPPALTAVCLAGTLLAFAVGNEPVNRKAATWTPATLPSDWPSYRMQWETAHAISAGLSLLALVVLILAAVRESSDPRAACKASRVADAAEQSSGDLSES